jgi:hypothetical protein
VRLQSDVRWRGGDALHHHKDKPDYFVSEMKKTELLHLPVKDYLKYYHEVVGLAFVLGYEEE